MPKEGVSNVNTFCLHGYRHKHINIKKYTKNKKKYFPAKMHLKSESACLIFMLVASMELAH